MKELLALAATVIEATVAEPRHSATQTVLTMVATIIAALCAVGTLICLLIALWLYEMPVLGEVGAPLVVASVLAVMTLIIGVALHIRAAPPPPPPHPWAVGAALLSALMRSNKGLVLLGALLAGFAASEGGRR